MESCCFGAHLCCVVPALQWLVYVSKPSAWKADQTRVCVNLSWFTFLKEYHSFPAERNQFVKSYLLSFITVWLSFPSLIWCWSFIRMQPRDKCRMGSAAHSGQGGSVKFWERPCLHLHVVNHLGQSCLKLFLHISYHLLNRTDVWLCAKEDL